MPLAVHNTFFFLLLGQYLWVYLKGIPLGRYPMGSTKKDVLPVQSDVLQASASATSPTQRSPPPLQVRVLNLDPEPQEAEH